MSSPGPVTARFRDLVGGYSQVLSSPVLIMHKKCADFSGVYPLPNRCSFFFSPLILHLKRGALLRPTLPTIIQPCRGNVGMPQPLLHFGNVGIVRYGTIPLHNCPPLLYLGVLACCSYAVLVEAGVTHPGTSCAHCCSIPFQLETKSRYRYSPSEIRNVSF